MARWALDGDVGAGLHATNKSQRAPESSCELLTGRRAREQRVRRTFLGRDDPVIPCSPLPPRRTSVALERAAR